MGDQAQPQPSPALKEREEAQERLWGPASSATQCLNVQFSRFLLQGSRVTAGQLHTCRQPRSEPRASARRVLTNTVPVVWGFIRNHRPQNNRPLGSREGLGQDYAADQGILELLPAGGRSGPEPSWRNSASSTRAWGSGVLEGWVGRERPHLSLIFYNIPPPSQACVLQTVRPVCLALQHQTGAGTAGTQTRAAARCGDVWTPEGTGKGTQKG